MTTRLVAVILLVVILAAGSAPTARGRQDDAPRRWCVSVWYPSSEHPGGAQSIRDHLDVIDEVNPFWYAAGPDGALLSLPGAEDAARLREWRDAGLLILPTIAHASPDAITDPDVRARHIEAIVALVERLDVDGIDIDYEEFPLATRDAFSAFVEALADRLHADGRLLSIAVHAKTTDRPGWDSAAAQDWARLAAAVDIFRIMTYDFHSRASREPGPIGPPGWSREVLAYAATVTDLGKVRLGLHFYGYRWQRGSAAVVTWESAQRAIESYGLAFERDPASMEAILRVDVRGLPRQTIVVADAAGLAYKLDQIAAAFPDLGGVAIWGLGGEDPANWDVLREQRQGECE